MRRRKKKRRQQHYKQLWDIDPIELARMLGISGVEGVAMLMKCSRWTVGRAIQAKGLKREHGTYEVEPPDPSRA